MSSDPRRSDDEATGRRLDLEEEFEVEAAREEQREALSGEGALADVPLPDDAHAEDVELHGRGRIREGGPPAHRRLTPEVEELGARALEGQTQVDPSAAEEAAELEHELADDAELSVRRPRFPDETEEREPEEGEGPSSPSGSPPNA